MTMSYWLENAWLSSGPASRVRVVTEGERISSLSVGAQPQAADKVIRGLVMPGFANTHSHIFHRALRGVGGTGSSFWAWREMMYRVANRLTPELYYEFALAGYQEMLRGGYTSVGEFHYLHHQPDGSPYADPNAMGKAVVAAAEAAGIRLTLLDTAYFSSGFGAPPISGQRRFCDSSAQGWAERVSLLTDTSMMRVGSAIHSVRAVSPEQAEIVTSWAVENRAPLHVHLSEQVAENEKCAEVWGVTPTQLLARSGVWSPLSTAVHATHLTESDIAILAEAGARVALCPSTEADLADGLPPLRSFVRAGVPLAVGSDQNVSSDALGEIQAVDALVRLLSQRREGLGAAGLISDLSQVGQESLGWPDAGQIAVGRLADWVVIALDSPRLAGCALSEIPRAATAADIVEVIVAARTVARPDTDSGRELAVRLGQLCSKVRAEKP